MSPLIDEARWPLPVISRVIPPLTCRGYNPSYPVVRPFLVVMPPSRDPPWWNIAILGSPS